MFKLKLYPYKWVKICFCKIYFGSSWEEVEAILGKPQKRLMDFNYDDFDKILTRLGRHRRNYCNRKPIKGNFFEDRENVRFIYKDYKLCTVEVIGRGAVHLDDEYLDLNVPLSERIDNDIIEDEILEKMKVCILRDFGMIIQMYNNTKYILSEKPAFDESVKSYHRVFSVLHKKIEKGK